MFPKGDVPVWVREAMVVADIDLEGVATMDVPRSHKEDRGANEESAIKE
jgi:hypothetical protein